MAKSYTAMPAVPPEMVERYRIVMEVLSGALTMSEGARQAGLSRNHFQTLVHRATAGIVEGLSPKEAGRPPMPQAERRLQLETLRLKKENERLLQRAHVSDRLLGVATSLLHPRSKGKRKTPPEPEGQTEGE
jgi:transposase-like protein